VASLGHRTPGAPRAKTGRNEEINANEICMNAKAKGPACRNTLLAEAVSNAYKVDRDWPTVLNMLIKGGGEDDSDQPEIPHPASSLAPVTRRIQIVREYLSAIPRRRLVDGTKGKTIIPFKAILHTVPGIPQTPLIKDDVVSLGSQGSKTSPQAKGMEAKLTAGGGAIASTPDVTKALPGFRPAPRPPDQKVQQPFRRSLEWMKQPFRRPWAWKK
jgi:hypothetical protein